MQSYRPNNFPPVVKNLLILNVLFFIANLTLSNRIYLEGLEIFGLNGVLGLWPIQTPFFKPYQIFTHLFSHANLGHIFFNMFGLWMFGKILENLWGPKRFLFFYIACGLGAAAAHLVVQYITGDPIFAVGASGAVMGIFVAFGYLFPNTQLYMMFIPIPIKAKYVMLGLVALDLFGGFARISGDNIAHFAHLGGALTGFIIVLFWNKTNRRTLY
jgi:membrane associated rhomboid family serine protease